MLIEPEDLPNLLSKVADLISQRAARIVERQMKQAEHYRSSSRARPIFSITAS